jgi:hypothetical protein
MATVSVSNTVGSDPSAAIIDFYKFLARDPSTIAQASGKGNLRCLATTTDATTGTFVTLTSITLDPTAGPLTFDANTARVIRCKAIGKPVGAATTTEYFEQAILVIGGTTPTVIAPAAATTSISNAVDNGTVGAFINALAGAGTLALQLTGKAATALSWTIDVTVDDPIPVT